VPYETLPIGPLGSFGDSKMATIENNIKAKFAKEEQEVEIKIFFTKFGSYYFLDPYALYLESFIVVCTIAIKDKKAAAP
jgi:hypothetical protein